MTGFEGPAFKLLCDAVAAGVGRLFKRAKSKKEQDAAEKAVSEAIRDMLKAPNDVKSVEAKMMIVRAAKGLDVERKVAEEMLDKIKNHTALGNNVPAKKALAKKAAAKKIAAKKAPAKKAAAKKIAAKKAPAKKAAAKKIAAKKAPAKKGAY